MYRGLTGRLDTEQPEHAWVRAVFRKGGLAAGSQAGVILERMTKPSDREQNHRSV